MKKSLILSAMMLMTAVPVLAGVDIHETTSPQYLYNGGYSDEAIRLIQYNKAYANGENLRAEEEQKARSKGWGSKFLDYLDPSRDDGRFFNRSIQMSTPTYEDL
ncbi:TPA: hypothetical protein IAC10_05170 [Candidatus Scatousia excrementigallinarum]|uniref:Uncharacterized protein n=1 Tax=Candidatus Scatousia excrementigallinarum TaxID=2840935 RepID=A0A9D1JNA1_9BACT|nr:hypothetical protein [Candidatus Scatousia excrementigallinarum]